MYKVNVYVNDQCDDVMARVNYTNNLDFWDGSNWNDGSVGHHVGLTKLTKSGQYVLIHGTQWEGERDWAEVISPEDALQIILKNESTDLLDNPRFAGLKKLAEALDSDEVEEGE